MPRIPHHSLLKHIVMKRRSVKKIKESVFFLNIYQACIHGFSTRTMSFPTFSKFSAKNSRLISSFSGDSLSDNVDDWYVTLCDVMCMIMLRTRRLGCMGSRDT